MIPKSCQIFAIIISNRWHHCIITKTLERNDCVNHTLCQHRKTWSVCCGLPEQNLLQLWKAQNNKSLRKHYDSFLKMAVSWRDGQSKDQAWLNTTLNELTGFPVKDKTLSFDTSGFFCLTERHSYNETHLWKQQLSLWYLRLPVCGQNEFVFCYLLVADDTYTELYESLKFNYHSFCNS